MKKLLFFLSLSAMLFGFSSCENDQVEHSLEFYTTEEFSTLRQNLNLPSIPHDYQQFFFGGPNSNNVNDIATLGRVLFYDKQLSKDNSVSCGSCHQQHLAFADDKDFSKGIENRSTARNTLALGIFQSFSSYSENPTTTLFWDGRVDNLHDQMIQTIANPNEMGMELNDVVKKIDNFEYYKILSKKAFNTDKLNEERVLQALSGFMNSFVSNDSRFDHASQTTPFFSEQDAPNFTASENMGKNLFKTNCAGCHSNGMNGLVSIFGNDVIREANNGLDLVYTDKGVGEIIPLSSKVGVFKVPALRNIELTGPYMHDGRFATLEEVVDFYSDGIQDHDNLHHLLKQGSSPKKFNFTETQKQALVDFLKTMTDVTMTQQEKWSDPFL